MRHGAVIHSVFALRAKMAQAMGWHSVAQLLRGYAETLQRAPGMVTQRRLAEQIAERVPSDKSTPEALLWLDALRDLDARHPVAVAEGYRRELLEEAASAVRFERRAKRQAKVIAGLRAQLAEAEAEAAKLRGELDRIADTSGSILEVLGRQPLAGGRTWRDVAEAIAQELGVADVEQALLRRHVRGRSGELRRRFWRALHEAGVPLARIGRVVGRDHTTIRYAVLGPAPKSTRRPKLRAAG